MTATKTFPFTVYGVDPAGINIVTYVGADAITSRVLTLRPAETLEITEVIHSYNVDRNGNSFLDLSAEEQISIWGRVRFGVGSEVPETVAATAKAERDALARQELDFLVRSNPHIARQIGAARRAEELQNQIAGTR